MSLRFFGCATETVNVCGISIWTEGRMDCKTLCGVNRPTNYVVGQKKNRRSTRPSGPTNSFGLLFWEAGFCRPSEVTHTYIHTSSERHTQRYCSVISARFCGRIRKFWLFSRRLYPTERVRSSVTDPSVHVPVDWSPVQSRQHNGVPWYDYIKLDRLKENTKTNESWPKLDLSSNKRPTTGTPTVSRVTYENGFKAWKYRNQRQLCLLHCKQRGN